MDWREQEYKRGGLLEDQARAHLGMHLSGRDRNGEHLSNQQFLLKDYRGKLRNPTYLAGFKPVQLCAR